jgi:CTP:molybdopterin cytidylyltransferase MocA
VTRVVCAVLAAGASTRLGRPKQLVAVDGEPLLGRTLRVARASRAEAVAVVLGASRDAIEAAIDFTGVAVLRNDAWPEGMASSIRAAVAWATSEGAAGLLLLVCDQPRLTASHLDALLEQFSAQGRTVGSAYRETIGVPAVFGRAQFEGLASLRGDRGARALLREPDVLAVAWPDGVFDVDTPADLRDGI